MPIPKNKTSGLGAAAPCPEPATHVTRIDAKGVALIESFESFSAKPYKCPAGVWTIGYGSTYYENGKRVLPTDASITQARAESLLYNVLSQYENAVDSFTPDTLSQDQFDALVSFAYNVGIQALRGSTLLKKVVANPADPEIRDEFMKWVNGGGKKLPGLVRRRAAEADLYFSGTGTALVA